MQWKSLLGLRIMQKISLPYVDNNRNLINYFQH